MDKAGQTLTSKTVSLSLGDMALTLMGRKTLHFVAPSQDFTPGERILLTSPDAPDIHIPVIVTESRLVPDGVLDRKHLDRAGRHLPPRFHKGGKHEFHIHYIGPEEHKGSDYRQLSFRRLKVSDIPSGEAGRPELKALYQDYREATRLIEAHLRSVRHRRQLGREERRNHLTGNGFDQTVADALDYLSITHGVGNLDDILRALKQPQEEVGAQLRRTRSKTVKALDAAHHGGRHGREMEMADYTALPENPGTAALLAMGAVKRIAFRSHPNLRGMRQGDRYGTGILSAEDGKLGANHHAQRGFSLPVQLDMEDVTTFFASDIDETLAREHGHLSPADMRKAFAIKKDENPVLLSYATRVMYPQEMGHRYENKAQVHFNQSMGPVFEAWGKSNHPSMARAHAFLETMPEADRAKALRRIAPPRELKADPGAILARNGERTVPAATNRAWRLPVQDMSHVAQVERIEKPKAIKPKPKPGRTEGEGWRITTSRDAKGRTLGGDD